MNVLKSLLIIKFILILIITILHSCKNEQISKENFLQKNLDTLKPKYSNKFIILKNENYKIIRIRENENAYKDYILCQNSEKNCHIKIPIKKVICLSSTHIAMLDFISEINSIIAVTNRKHCYSENILNKIEQGKIKEIGFEENLNTELILSLKPDVIFAYNLNFEANSNLTLIEKYNIPVININEFKEEHPLGRSEWGIIIASLFNKEDLFIKKFDSIEKNYINIKKNIEKSISNKPMVFMGTPWKDVWYIAPSNSFAAHLLKDAGFNYVFDNVIANKAIPLDFETVYNKCKNAEYWLNLGNFNSLKELAEADKRFANFKAYQTGNIFNNNKRINKLGANDYWETGIMRPDLILLDLYLIHTQKTDNSLYFYKKLF